MQSKKQTALWIAGSNPEFWHAIATSECYDQVASDYDNIDWEDMVGTSLNDETIDLEEYPIRQRPGTRPSY